MVSGFPEYEIYRRRFGRLNSLNLLYLQAELVMLEITLQKYAAEDVSTTERGRHHYRLKLASVELSR